MNNCQQSACRVEGGTKSRLLLVSVERAVEVRSSRQRPRATQGRDPRSLEVRLIAAIICVALIQALAAAYPATAFSNVSVYPHLLTAAVHGRVRRVTIGPGRNVVSWLREVVMWNSYSMDGQVGVTAEITTFGGGGGDEIHAYVASPVAGSARPGDCAGASHARVG